MPVREGTNHLSHCDFVPSGYYQPSSILCYVCLSVYGSAVPVVFGRVFSFLICTQLVGLLGRGISPSQGR
jgi:hypothetical protein